MRLFLLSTSTKHPATLYGSRALAQRHIPSTRSTFNPTSKTDHPFMTLAKLNPCPFGVLNLNAAAEASSILRESSKAFHQQLYSWLIETYLYEAIRMVVSKDYEPLGRRIRSVEDLSMLVCAYSNARALKQKTKKTKMDNELYFYGQLPDRDAAVEAGGIVRTQFDPEVTVGTGIAVNGRLAL